MNKFRSAVTGALLALVLGSWTGVYAQVARIPGGGGGSGGIAVGGAVTSGTDTRVFFQDGAGVGQDADFTWNKTTNILTPSGGIQFNLNSSPYIANSFGGTQITFANTGYLTFTAGNFDVLRLTPNTGHITVTSQAAPTVSACGTSPSTVTGTDTAGTLTTGSGGTVQSCTLTFSGSYGAVAPRCMVSNETTILLVRATATATTLVLDSAVAGTLASQVLKYICIG